VIVAEHLTKRFGARTAVDRVSFTVERGEVVGFLGPNGAGKTTTIRLLAGVFPPSSGRALIGGLDVATRPLAARRRLGYAPRAPGARSATVSTSPRGRSRRGAGSGTRPSVRRCTAR